MKVIGRRGTEDDGNIRIIVEMTTEEHAEFIAHNEAKVAAAKAARAEEDAKEAANRRAVETCDECHYLGCCRGACEHAGASARTCAHGHVLDHTYCRSPQRSEFVGVFEEGCLAVDTQGLFWRLRAGGEWKYEARPEASAAARKDPDPGIGGVSYCQRKDPHG